MARAGTEGQRCYSLTGLAFSPSCGGKGRCREDVGAHCRLGNPQDGRRMMQVRSPHGEQENSRDGASTGQWEISQRAPDPATAGSMTAAQASLMHQCCSYSLARSTPAWTCPSRAQHRGSWAWAGNDKRVHITPCLQHNQPCGPSLGLHLPLGQAPKQDPAQPPNKHNRLSPAMEGPGAKGLMADG